MRELRAKRTPYVLIVILLALVTVTIPSIPGVTTIKPCFIIDFGGHTIMIKLTKIKKNWSRIRAAEKTRLVRKKALDQTYGRKVKAVQMAIRFSPPATYDLATEALAGTNLQGIERFAESSRQYRCTLIEHLREKKAFSSRQWFSHDKGRVRWDDLPQFSYQRADLGSDLIDVVPDLILLLSINLAIFVAVYLTFRRQAI